MWSASRPWPVISWKRTPAEAAADHHRHRAGGRRIGVQQGERDPRGALGGALGGAVLDQLEAAVAAQRLEAGLDPVPLRRATTWTPSRTRVRSSAANRPLELATVTRRRPSA